MSCFFLADIPITGMLSRLPRASISMRIPFLFASSNRLMQRATRGVISRICRTRLRFLLRQVASATITVRSASPKHIWSRAIFSSGEFDITEYVPGRSKILYTVLFETCQSVKYCTFADIWITCKNNFCRIH